MLMLENIFKKIATLVFMSMVFLNAYGAAGTEDDANKKVKTKRDPPEIHILNVQVKDSELSKKLKNFFPGGNNKPGTTLIGSGDVSITIKNEDYKTMIHYIEEVGEKPTLFLNGVDLKDDAMLVSTEPDDLGMRLGYFVKPGKYSQILWAVLFRGNNLKDPTSLRAGVGWNGSPATSIDSNAKRFVNNMQVSDNGSIVIALLAIVVLAGIWLYIMFATDTFRDPPTDPRWRQAANLQSVCMNSKDSEAALRIYDSSFDPSKTQQYDQYAQIALQEGIIKDQMETDTLFGLARQRKRLRSSFSLGRLQLGVWFLFAILASVFFWILYGDLLALDGSVLAIVTLSVGVAGMSIAVDTGAGRPFKPTQGILRDLTTGFDDQQKVYRFQAVIVNLLLLFIGIFHVFQQLSYPTFDPSWLAFLGLSGVALAGGKQLTETNSAAVEPPSQTIMPVNTTSSPAPMAENTQAVG